MRDFTDRLRAAAAEPPPTSIDLDVLIERERRRGRLVRFGSVAGATVAAATAIVVAIGVATAGQAPVTPAATGASGESAPNVPVPSGSEPVASVASEAPLPCGVVIRASQGTFQSFSAPRPDPTDPGTVGRRLSTVVNEVLSGYLPQGATVRDDGHVEGCNPPLFVHLPERRTYGLSLVVGDKAGTGTVGIGLMPQPLDFTGCQGLVGDGSEDCERISLGDGSDTATYKIVRTGSAGNKQFSIIVMRRDGTMVSVGSSNMAGSRRTVTRPEPPLTVDQLMRLVRTPGLTLYP